MSHKISSFAGAYEALEAFKEASSTRLMYSLDYVVQLMDFLGNPQDKVSVIHVAGTSGKTSTAYYIAALLQASGKKVGLSVSPHLQQLNERLQIGMKPVSEAVYCRAFEEFLALVRHSKIAVSRFEFLAAFQYWYFAREKVDYAVIEAGMGGLLDATNTVTRADKVCVITDIGLDHVQMLGPELTDIAEHKAGIIQPGNTIFCYRQNAEVTGVVRREAKQKHADLHVLTKAQEAANIDTLPLFQRRNLGLARAVASWVLEQAGEHLEEKAVAAAAAVRVPGRMEVFELKGKKIILDGAHNPQKIQTLAKSLASEFEGQQIAMLTAFVEGSEQRQEANAAELTKLTSHVIITSFESTDADSHQSAAPPMLQAMFARAGAKSVAVQPDLFWAWLALQERPEPVLLVTGSLYLVGRVRTMLSAQQ